MGDTFLAICPYCHSEYEFAQTAADAADAGVVQLLPIILGDVAGVPKQRVWILECECGNDIVLRKTLYNAENIQKAVERQEYVPDTPMPHRVYWWTSCSAAEFRAELAQERDPEIIRRVKEAVAQAGVDFPWPLEWAEAPTAQKAPATSRGRPSPPG